MVTLLSELSVLVNFPQSPKGVCMLVRGCSFMKVEAFCMIGLLFEESVLVNFPQARKGVCIVFRCCSLVEVEASLLINLLTEPAVLVNIPQPAKGICMLFRGCSFIEAEAFCIIALLFKVSKLVNSPQVIKGVSIVFRSCSFIKVEAFCMIRLPLKLPELVNSPQQPKGVCIATFGSFAQATVRVAWCTFPVLAAPSRMSSWPILFWALTLFAGSAACRPPGSAEMRIPAASASAARFERMEAFCGFFSRSRAFLASCCSRRLGAGPARPYPHQVLANKTWRSCFAIYPVAWSDHEPELRPARRGAKLFWHSFTISPSI